MPTIITAIILGLVEGATEFLPVSSTGHLILAGHALGFVGPRADAFEIIIQLGAILAVVWLYRSLLWRVVRDGVAVAESRRFILALFVAFLPAAIVGLLTHHWILAHLFTPAVVIAAEPARVDGDSIQHGQALEHVRRLRDRVCGRPSA